jgi:thiol-disulfide isomerase/thioredoxin
VSSVFLCCLIFQSGLAQTDSVWGVGNRAPELKIEKWLKGGGFQSLKKGKVYLIDFWATWCVPCIAGMPHLSQLQQKYKDRGLDVIGITSNDPYGNTQDKVAAFVKSRQGLMQYDIAWVPESSKKNLTGIFVHPWMQKAGTMNLPTVFLVDRNGNIAYIGDPHTVDGVLDQVINGAHDLKTLEANYLSGLEAEKTCKQFEASLKENNFTEAAALGKKILNGYSYVKVNTLLVVGSSIGTLAQQKNIDTTLLEIGFTAARRGVVATRFESPGFLSTLASLYAAKKDYVQAIITQSLAITVSEGGMRDNQLKELEKYKAMAN